MIRNVRNWFAGIQAEKNNCSNARNSSASVFIIRCIIRFISPSKVKKKRKNNTVFELQFLLSVFIRRRNRSIRYSLEKRKACTLKARPCLRFANRASRRERFLFLGLPRSVTVIDTVSARRMLIRPSAEKLENKLNHRASFHEAKGHRRNSTLFPLPLRP